MIDFNVVNASSLEEATALLQKGDTKAMAGGTDLIGAFRREIYPSYPATVVNLQTIEGLDYIKEEDGCLKIGAMTKLQRIADSSIIREKYAALAQAAEKTASPQLRTMGTIAGNVCQDIRCWYMRSDENYFDCLKKGGQLCYAIDGENRYHSIFGGVRIEGLACSTECPSSIDIPTYVAMIKAGDMAGAATKLLERNPLAAVTGRVCPHFCESKCNRQALDESVSIRDLERVMGDYILEHAAELLTAPKTESGKKVAVIGAGPAGLSAAFYLRREGHAVTIFEANSEAGGMLTYAIPAYRLPKDIVQKLVAALQTMGVVFRLGVRIGADVPADELIRDYDAVFFGCGANKEQPSGIEGEEHILSGLHFLRGVYEQKLGAPGKKVAVLGGGNTAIDVARALIRQGAEVTLLYRRTINEMPAIKEDVDKAAEEGVKFEFLTQPKAVVKSNGVELRCLKMHLGEADASGRARPVEIPGSDFTRSFDSVISAFGEVADTFCLPAAYTDEKGWFKAGGKVFGGGDFVSGPSTVTEAIAGGRQAVEAIHKLFGGQDACTSCDGRLELCACCYQKLERNEAPELPVAQRTLSAEDATGYSAAQRDAEAKRCLNCSCVAVNSSDTAPVLIALDCVFVTTKREVPAGEFWQPQQPTFSGNVLAADEMIKEIRIPAPKPGTKSAFVKFANRGTIDFAIVNCAAVVSGDEAKICLNAVAPVPYRAYAAEEAVKGKAIDEAAAEAAGQLALADAIPLTDNKYKVEIAKAMVRRALLACK